MSVIAKPDSLQESKRVYTLQGTHKERSKEVSKMWWLAKRKFLTMALCIFICPIVSSCTEKASVLDEDTAIPCSRFKNCTELKRVHPDGVNTARLSCAKDRNKLDRDNDGWACE